MRTRTYTHQSGPYPNKIDVTQKDLTTGIQSRHIYTHQAFKHIFIHTYIDVHVNEMNDVSEHASRQLVLTVQHDNINNAAQLLSL